jgi:hypothetical protein
LESFKRDEIVLMDTQPAFGTKDLFTHLVGDIAKAVCERAGETRQQQIGRTEAAAHTVMGFMPRDVIEVLLASHCVMFHEMIVDSVHGTLRGDPQTTRRATRGNIVAMDKAFGNNLDRLERYQNRHAEGRRDAPEEASTEVEIAERVRRHQASAATPPSSAAKEAAAGGTPAPERQDAVGSVAVPSGPTPERIAACMDSQEAMDALDAGDAEGFARAMGVDVPGDAYLGAAAAEGSPFCRPGSGNGSGGRTDRVEGAVRRAAQARS